MGKEKENELEYEIDKLELFTDFLSSNDYDEDEENNKTEKKSKYKKGDNNNDIRKFDELVKNYYSEKRYKNITWEDIVKLINSPFPLDQETAKDAAIEKLYGFIIGIINSKCKERRYLFHDMFDEAASEICKNLIKYNLNYKPVTYFNTFIIGACDNVINKDSNKSAYYASIDRKVSKLVHNYMNLGYSYSTSVSVDNKVFTPVTIAAETGYSVKIVKKSLDRIFNKKTSASFEELEGIVNSNTLTPEQEFEEKERAENLLLAMKLLNNQQRFVVVSIIGFEGPKMKKTKVAELLNKPKEHTLSRIKTKLNNANILFDENIKEKEIIAIADKNNLLTEVEKEILSEKTYTPKDVIAIYKEALKILRSAESLADLYYEHKKKIETPSFFEDEEKESKDLINTFKNNYENNGKIINNINVLNINNLNF